MAKFKMKRIGQFQANWESRRNVCGVDRSLRPLYSYECEMETTDRLDDQGFIMDNKHVSEYFINKYASAKTAPLSCEMMAKLATLDILALLRRNGSEPKRVAVTIAGSAQAAMTYEWTEETDERKNDYDMLKPRIRPYSFY